MLEELISIIVVNWNKREFLHSCLVSLKNQTFKNREIIVVDNSSIDSSVEHVRTNFPDAKLITLSENKGFSVGNNLGIKNAQGEYIALINNDAQAHPSWLEELYAALNQNPNIGLVASKILFYDNRDTIDAVGNIFSAVGFAEKRGWMQRDSEEFNKPVKVFGACAGAAMYRKKVLIELGGFDEDFSPAYYEDVDLDFRAQLKGYQCLYVPSAVVYHRITSTIELYSPKHIYLCNRNLTYVLIKDMPTTLLLKYSLKIFIYFIVSVLYHYIKGRGNAYFFGRIAAFKKLPVMLNKRRVIQRTRVVSDRYVDSIMIKGRSLCDVKNFLNKRLAFIKVLKKNENCIS